jgi:soluble lytic murein transglycosylase-like protein
MSNAAGGAEGSLPSFSDILETVISNTNLQSPSASESKVPNTAGSTVDLDAIFQKASDTYHVPVELLKAVAKAESNFNPKAESHAGAKGIMQLMPGTAKALGVTDPFDPEQSIMGGAKYLSQQLARYDGNAVLALAAYNAGPGNVAKYNGVPPFKETQNYISKVMGYTGETLTAGETVFPGVTNTVDMDVRDYALLMDLYRYRMQLSVLTESESDAEPNDLFGNIINLV